MLSIYRLSFAADGRKCVYVYRVSSSADDDDDPCRRHPGTVVVSVPLNRRIYGDHHDVAIRGPGCRAFDLPVLKGRATLHFVFPLDVVKQAVERRTGARFKYVSAGPRVANDAFVHGLALALVELIDVVGVDAPEAGVIITILSIHIGLEYAVFRRHAARVLCDERAAITALGGRQNSWRGPEGPGVSSGSFPLISLVSKASVDVHDQPPPTRLYRCSNFFPPDGRTTAVKTC
jgi:hypothetical protein